MSEREPIKRGRRLSTEEAIDLFLQRHGEVLKKMAANDRQEREAASLTLSGADSAIFLAPAKAKPSKRLIAAMKRMFRLTGKGGSPC